MVRNAFLRRNIVFALIVIMTMSSFSVIFITPYDQAASQPKNNSVTITNSNNNPSFLNQVISDSNIQAVMQKASNFFFTKNVGQLGSISSKYYFKTNGLQISFLPSEIQFVEKLSSDSGLVNFSLTFPGSNLVNPVGQQQLDRINNYFIGKTNFVNVPVFKTVIYRNIYNGIDLQYYFNDKGLKYDFIVHQGANPNQIHVSSSNNAFISAKTQQITFFDKTSQQQLLTDNHLFVYQSVKSAITSIPATFSVTSNQNNAFSYSISSYDKNLDLIIDPVLVINTSTYLGGSSADEGFDIVRDNQNNIYITGTTESIDFPTMDALNSTNSGAPDIFIMKLNSTGTGVIWATYFGGNDEDWVNRIALDNNNNVVIAGYTWSTDLPLKHSQNTDLNGTQDILVASFTNDGQQLLLCSLIGGSGDYEEDALGLYASPTSSTYYLTGYTDSSDFMTTNGAYNTTFGGYEDAFFLTMTGSGTIEYSSFIGGNFSDAGTDIYVDNTGNIYLLGSVAGNLTGVVNNGIGNDVFVMKFAPNGLTLLYTSLIGGDESDYSSRFVVKNNDVYLTGRSFSTNFPNTAEFGINQSDQSAFVVKLNATGSIDYSILLTVNSSISVADIAIDSLNQVIIAGTINGNNLPLQNEIQYSGVGQTGFITMFNSQGSAIIYSTYLGGSELDSINGFVLGTNYDVYLIGSSRSLNYPVNNAMQDHLSSIGNPDAVFTKLSLDYITPTLSLSPDVNFEAGTTGHNMTFTASDNDPYANYMLYKNASLIGSGLLPKTNVSFSLDSLSAGVYNYTVTAQDRSGNTISKSAIVTVTSSSSNGSSIPDLLPLIVFGIVSLVTIGSVLGYNYLKKKNSTNEKESNTTPRPDNQNSTSTASNQYTEEKADSNSANTTEPKTTDSIDSSENDTT